MSREKWDADRREIIRRLEAKYEENKEEIEKLQAENQKVVAGIDRATTPPPSYEECPACHCVHGVRSLMRPVTVAADSKVDIYRCGKCGHEWSFPI